MDKPDTPRILVVDDEVSVCVTLAALLRRQGYIVTTATNGAEALASIMRDPFDLFLIDLMLPGISGLDLAKTAHIQQPAAALLILTGSTEQAEAPLKAQMHAFPYLHKTASPQQVLDQVAALLHH